jgi:hypothetical protein
MGGFADILFAKGLSSKVRGAMRSMGLLRRGNRI